MNKVIRRPMLILLILVIVVIGLLVAYRANSGNLSKALVQTNPGCHLPCWNGLRPGETTEIEFLSVTQNSSGAAFNDVERFDHDKDVFFYRWHDSSFNLLVDAVFEDGILASVGIWVHTYRLGDIIELLGSPDHYQAVIGGGEQDMLSFYTFYESEGVFVDLFTVPYEVPPSASRPTCSIDVSEKIEASVIYIVQRNTPEAMLQQVWAVKRSPIHPWTGFGNIALSECY